ncbi:MAG: deoxynucleoside kinase [Chitinispirillales bacterium]|jgi:deoxyadenosine/deoxycytidine kinase|nr:deoxynucleoside kinase [Chitinispirillales bacterium]
MQHQQKELKFPPHVNYLCIEGVLGVGKTSLCELLGRLFGARLVLEDVGDNPFLPKFYSDRLAYAFQAQIWFLLSRHRQLSGMVAQQDLFHSVTVSDYMFAKDGIFAGINLREDEMALYSAISRMLETTVLQPDLVVYLQASTETLLKRIEKRGRSFESQMDAQYIDDLNEAYNRFFFSYTASPLLIINTNEIDFIDDTRDFFEVIEQIVNAKAGTNIYNPMGAKERMLIEGK